MPETDPAPEFNRESDPNHRWWIQAEILSIRAQSEAVNCWKVITADDVTDCVRGLNIDGGPASRPRVCDHLVRCRAESAVHEVAAPPRAHEIADLDRPIHALVDELVPTLVERVGVGYQLLITAGDNPEQLTSLTDVTGDCGWKDAPAIKSRLAGGYCLLASAHRSRIIREAGQEVKTQPGRLWPAVETMKKVTGEGRVLEAWSSPGFWLAGGSQSERCHPNE